HVDLGRLLGARGAELDVGALPLSPALRICRPGDAIGCALTGGDDYELCFTVAPGRGAGVERLREHLQVPLTRLGRVTGEEGFRRLLDGRPFNVPDSGFRHF